MEHTPQGCTLASAPIPVHAHDQTTPYAHLPLLFARKSNRRYSNLQRRKPLSLFPLFPGDLLVRPERPFSPSPTSFSRQQQRQLFLPMNLNFFLLLSDSDRTDPTSHTPRLLLSLLWLLIHPPSVPKDLQLDPCVNFMRFFPPWL